MTEDFASRVRTFHLDWQDRRAMESAASLPTISRNRETLLLLHGWVVDAADDVERTYGEDLHLVVTPIEWTSDDRHGEFRVVLSPLEALRPWIYLEFKTDADDLRQPTRVIASVVLGDGLREAPVGRPSRHATWSRHHVEDALLHLLAAFERARPPAAQHRFSA